MVPLKLLERKLLKIYIYIYNYYYFEIKIIEILLINRCLLY